MNLPVYSQPALPDLPCFLNGEFTTLPHAKISVMDRGFIFGDGVYEVVPIYAGAPFRFQQHLARLGRSLAELRIKNPYSAQQWCKIVSQLVANYSHTIMESNHDSSNISLNTPSKTPDQLIYIQITRGVALRDHVMPEHIAPTVFAMANLLKMPTAAQRQAGVACVTAEDFRWQKAHIKATSLLGAVFARQISFDAGALETVMFRDGFLSEAAASNVWVVQNGRLLGVPKDHLVLEGIRYGLFAELCAHTGLTLELRRITRAEVLAADELLLSSATKEVLAITTLDGQAVGAAAHKGKPGPVYNKLYAAYQDAKAAEIAAFARDLV